MKCSNIRPYSILVGMVHLRGLAKSKKMKRQVSFAEQLRYEREKHGWSQEDVASKIGCDTKTVARWESGESRPRTYYRQKISKIFGKDLVEFRLVPQPADDALPLLASQIMSQPAFLPSIPDTENSQFPYNQIAESITNSFPAVSYAQAATYLRIQGFPPLAHPSTIQQREHVVKTIAMKLLQSDITALVLTGMGGVGKSTLAALVYQYVREQYQTNSEVFTAEPIWLTISEHVTI